MGTPAQPPAQPLTPAEGTLLAGIAVRSVRAGLLGERLAGEVPGPASLREVGASFVTLERGGRLRGCIGTLRAARPLYLDVIRNARRAMSDPRLPPVEHADWPDLDVTVSVLTPPDAIRVSGLSGLLAELRPGRDGLVLSDGARRATFLPSVWQRLTDPVEFVAALLAKGGWARHSWPAGMTAYRYRAYEFRDPPPRDPLTARHD